MDAEEEGMEVEMGSRAPWVGLGAAVWVQMAAGSGYTFPLYSHSLKSVLGLSQQQLTILGVANDVGENVGVLPGVVCNRLPPWAVLLIGAACSFFGFGILWLSVTRTVPSIPYWLLWIALVIATNSSAWLGTGVVVTNMRNFPLSRGTVAGLLKGYAGLSAAVFTEIYSGVLSHSSTSLLLLLTLGIPSVCLLSMYFIRPLSPLPSSNPSHFLFIQISSFLLGLYLLLTTLIPVKLSLSYAFLSGMILLLFSPLLIPLKISLCPSSQDSPAPEKTTGGSPEDPLLPEKKRKPRRGEDFDFLEALVKADFWLLFVVYFFGVGSGVTVLNNLAQIGIAAGVENTTVLLSIFSFCNFLGRLGGGVVSEHFVRSRALPRSVWMGFTQIAMIVVFLVSAISLSSTLYFSVALLGICYGVQICIMVPTASELFGLKDFGIIYNFLSLGNPIGAFLFSGLLAGYVYDREAERQSSQSCMGAGCFRLTFFFLAAVCGVGSMLSFVLTVRIRPVYQMLYSGGSFQSRTTTKT